MSDAQQRTFSEDEKNDLKRKRSACELCRKRKIKCDGGSPCLTCTKTQNPCVYIESKRRGPKVGHITKLKSENSLLRQQLNVHSTPSLELDCGLENKYLQLFMTHINPDTHFIPTSVLIDSRWKMGSMEERFVYYGCISLGARLMGNNSEAQLLFEQTRVLGTTQYDEPSEYAMAGFLLLTLYCIGMGDASKATMYVSLALNMARVLPLTDNVEQLCITEQSLNVVGFMLFRLVGPPTIPILKEIRTSDPVSKLAISLLRVTFIVMRPPSQTSTKQFQNALDGLDAVIQQLDSHPTVVGLMTFAYYIKAWSLKARLWDSVGNLDERNRCIDQALHHMDTPLLQYVTPMLSIIIVVLARMTQRDLNQSRFNRLSAALQQLAFTWPSVRNMLERFNEEKHNFSFFPKRITDQVVQHILPKMEQQITEPIPELADSDNEDIEPDSDQFSESDDLHNSSLDHLLNAHGDPTYERMVNRDHLATISVPIASVADEWLNQFSSH
eukprot:TRINITY_DN5600_c0_g1_i1.p1 TRINITY_DN5600_c0_g1~~TRINITY_DN5600_c0_g1_i1.p1  ORF type:complete len:498 (-),score=65.90 TRINITY_DN5600_c0_g1_i1:77-1570(-)